MLAVCAGLRWILIYHDHEGVLTALIRSISFLEAVSTLEIESERCTCKERGPRQSQTRPHRVKTVTRVIIF